MPQEFSITLPSNSKTSGYEPNSSSSFLVRLPETIQLGSDKWVCGLSEIIYTNSFENLPNGGEITVSYVDGEKKVFTVNSGNFRDAYNFLQNLWNVKSRQRGKRDASEISDKEKEQEELRKKYEQGLIPVATSEEIENFKNFKKKQAEEAERKAEEQAKIEAEQKAKLEAEKKAIAEALQKAKLAVEQKAKLEAEQKAKDEAARKADNEAKRKAKEEADRKANEEVQKKAKEEAERRAKSEADKKAAATAAAASDQPQVNTNSNSSQDASVSANTANRSVESTGAPHSTHTPNAAPTPSNHQDASGTTDSTVRSAPAQPHPSPSGTSSNIPSTLLMNNFEQNSKAIVNELKTLIENERKLRQSEITQLSRLEEHQNKITEKIVSVLEEGNKQTGQLLFQVESGNKSTERLLVDIIAGQKTLSSETKKASFQSRTSSTAGLAEHQFKKYGFSFDYDALVERIVVKIDKSKISQIDLSPNLAYFCGFSSESLSQVFNYAVYKIDFFNNMSSMYIYSDVIQPSIVADKKSQLLRVVPASLDVNSVQSVTFNPTRYFPVSRESIDCIKVDICDSFGENIRFHHGSTICTLHFVKIS